MGNEQNHERRKAANGAERREERRNATEQLLSRLFLYKISRLDYIFYDIGPTQGSKWNKQNGNVGFTSTVYLINICYLDIYLINFSFTIFDVFG